MNAESPSAAPARNTALIVSTVANGVLAAGLAAAVVLYFQASSGLESSRAQVASLQAEVEKVKGDLSREAARAAELKSDLGAARANLQSLRAQSSKLKSEVEARERALAEEKARAKSAQAPPKREKAGPPAVPVRVTFRQAGLGRGQIGIFSNYSSIPLPVVIALHNPNTGQRKRFSIRIAPGTRAELGHLDGWRFASGDQVAIRSQGYEPLRVTVP